MVSDGEPSDYERRENGKIRAEAKKWLFKNLDLALEDAFFERVAQFPEVVAVLWFGAADAVKLCKNKDPRIPDELGDVVRFMKKFWSALNSLKKDLSRSGYVVYNPKACTEGDGRRFGRVVRKHLEPIFRDLPPLPPIDLEDPLQYLSIARKIEEWFENYNDVGKPWSIAQNCGGNFLILVLQSLSIFYRNCLPEKKIGICKICPRIKTSGSEYCRLHTRACNKTSNAGMGGNRARYAEARRKKPSNFTPLVLKEYICTRNLSHPPSGYQWRIRALDEKFNPYIIHSWPAAKAPLAAALRTAYPHVFERIQTALDAPDWETAVQKMGLALEDEPPHTLHFSGVILWLCSFDAYFSAGFEKISPKTDQIRELLDQGMKQADLARSIGVSRQLVSRISREKQKENLLQVSLQRMG
ncbi:hypothetical protein LptCag_1381 [Leptospirillum ferriphilum]|jgi:antitoxin component HigA of HigAB toxin-antitoxin module|uniref:Uncharacterized protein n=2 Tax=Leptospirillum TaxID=179 RepID=A0A094YKD2_9BACT|nr:hypothetical protein [Leptospirillum ferriphilum]EDZ37962.1 MAG: Hypothetical protein CGL2_10608011 [Leptospirillum sp. Group II '5-way CG']KGA93671.1 hypothetical protein LptCag_1381 [Leptospirillum ferriphilum]